MSKNVIALAVSMMVALSTAQAKQKISVAVPMLPGFVTERNGEAKGAIVDRLLMAEENCDVSFDARVYPFKRVLHLTGAGQTDLGIFLRTAKRDEMARPVMMLGLTSILALPRQGLTIQDFPDFRNLHLAILNGSIAFPNITAQEGVEMHVFNGMSQGVDMLNASRVDAVVGPDFRIFNALQLIDMKFDDFPRPFKVMDSELWAYQAFDSPNLDQPFDELCDISDELRARGKTPFINLVN